MKPNLRMFHLNRGRLKENKPLAWNYFSESCASDNTTSRMLLSTLSFNIKRSSSLPGRIGAAKSIRMRSFFMETMRQSERTKSTCA